MFETHRLLGLTHSRKGEADMDIFDMKSGVSDAEFEDSATRFLSSLVELSHSEVILFAHAIRDGISAALL